MTGIPINNSETAAEAAKALAGRGVQTVIITLGKNGALLYQNNTVILVPAPIVQAVDTTAAGDVFNGALAVGETIKEAITFANHAAALSVTRLGAQSSAPGREEISF